jgi:hypothetical protein
LIKSSAFLHVSNMTGFSVRRRTMPTRTIASLGREVSRGVRRGFLEGPEAFRRIARFDDRWLDRVLAFLVGGEIVAPGGNEKGAA